MYCYNTDIYIYPLRLSVANNKQQELIGKICMVLRIEQKAGKLAHIQGRGQYKGINTSRQGSCDHLWKLSWSWCNFWWTQKDCIATQRSNIALDQGVANFFCNGSVGNILGCIGHMVTTTQLCHCWWKEGIEDPLTNECGCIPIKLYYTHTGSKLDLAHRLYFVIPSLDHFIDSPYKLFSTLNDKTKSLTMKFQELISLLPIVHAVP